MPGQFSGRDVERDQLTPIVTADRQVPCLDDIGARQGPLALPTPDHPTCGQLEGPHPDRVQRFAASDHQPLGQQGVAVESGLTDLGLEVVAPTDLTRFDIVGVVHARARADIDRVARDRGRDENSTARIVAPEAIDFDLRTCVRGEHAEYGKYQRANSVNETISKHGVALLSLRVSCKTTEQRQPLATRLALTDRQRAGSVERSGLEHRGHLQKERIPLLGALAELGGAALVRKLERAERWAVAVDEDGLNVASVDRRVSLQEELEI
jgi:hypothetical protein